MTRAGTGTVEREPRRRPAATRRGRAARVGGGIQRRLSFVLPLHRLQRRRPHQRRHASTGTSRPSCSRPSGCEGSGSTGTGGPSESRPVSSQSGSRWPRASTIGASCPAHPPMSASSATNSEAGSSWLSTCLQFDRRRRRRPGRRVAGSTPIATPNRSSSGRSPGAGERRRRLCCVEFLAPASDRRLRGRAPRADRNGPPRCSMPGATGSTTSRSGLLAGCCSGRGCRRPCPSSCAARSFVLVEAAIIGNRADGSYLLLHICAL